MFEVFFKCLVYVLLFGLKTVFFSFSTQSHAESSRNYLKNLVLDPTCAKLDQQSEHGHVHHVPEAPSEGETLKKHPSFLKKQQNQFLKSKGYCWLHKLRNTRGKIDGTYLGNIYGIYEEYIRNIHKC